jgi:suppressor of G2 allele of SKP1
MVGFETAEDLEKRGHTAFVEEDFEEAVSLYTDALALEPSSASLYVTRAAAHIKLENFTDAVADANSAIELNSKLSKAYLRKGVACFHLEEYETAKASFESGAALDPKTASFKSWISKCEAKLREENGEEAVAPKSAPAAVDNMETVAPAGSSEAPSSSEPQSQKEEPASSAPAPAAPAPPNYRHTWYQSQTHTCIEIFAKGVKKDDLEVDFGEQILSVVIRSGESEEPYSLQLRLFGKIIPAQCSYTPLSTKVEIKLAKAPAENTQWKQLEYDPKPQIVKTAVLPKADVEDKMKYPTSTKKPPKDWDRLEAEVKKEEKDEKLEGDAALNKLFREIYSNADEDTRRAMNKSFVESNGTVLSTNWKDVGKKKIEGSAPTGMDMKKWEI